jgi:hypothetical protein
VSDQSFLFPIIWKDAAEKIMREAMQDLLRKAEDATEENRTGQITLTLMLDGSPRDWKIASELSRPRGR